MPFLQRFGPPSATGAKNMSEPMEKYTNESGKECYRGATESTPFDRTLFHRPAYQFESDRSWALHTNLGSLTVLDRMTGFGYRDVESGFRSPDGKFWLASGDLDVRYSGATTLGEAIAWVKSKANNCIPDRDLPATNTQETSNV